MKSPITPAPILWERPKTRQPQKSNAGRALILAFCETIVHVGVFYFPAAATQSRPEIQALCQNLVLRVAVEKLGTQARLRVDRPALRPNQRGARAQNSLRSHPGNNKSISESCLRRYRVRHRSLPCASPSLSAVPLHRSMIVTETRSRAKITCQPACTLA